MINPFLITGDDGSRYADSCCSLNRMIIAEVPVKGIDDSIKGKRVMDIFSLIVCGQTEASERCIAEGNTVPAYECSRK